MKSDCKYKQAYFGYIQQNSYLYEAMEIAFSFTHFASHIRAAYLLALAFAKLLQTQNLYLKFKPS